MDNEFRYVCKCGAELSPSHIGPCPECRETGQVHKQYKKGVGGGSVGIKAYVNLRERIKGEGFRKFMKEILQGHFSSGDPKLKNGVEKVRITDKEINEYHEITRDSTTGEVTHDIHEPLTQHKHINK